MSPKAIQTWLQSEGYRARLEEDDEVAASIEGNSDGLPFRIVFCRPDPFDGDLDAFIDFSFFLTAEADENSTIEKINEENRKSKFVHASLGDDEGEDVVHFALSIPVSSNDLTESIFSQCFYSWTRWLPDMVEATVG